MPIYEYQCDACGARIEVMQKISDKPQQTCPSCKQRKLRKLVSASAFRLKGSGWYETDFKDKKKKNVSAAGDESTAAKGATATDDKPGAAAPAKSDGTGNAAAGKTADAPVSKAARDGD